MVDYKHLRTAEQIAAEVPALTLTTLEKWRFHRKRLGLEHIFIELGGSVFWDTRALNIWLFEGKPTTGDYRNLRTLKDVVARSSLLESKLRFWLLHRDTNGLKDAVITKSLGKHGKLYIDVQAFNQWLTTQNQNEDYRPPEQEKGAADKQMHEDADEGATVD